MSRLDNEDFDVYPMVDDPFDLRVRGSRTSSTKAVHLSDPMTGPWSGNNQLGISRPFSPDANNRQTILKLDEWGHPMVHTVTLGISYSEQAWAVSNFRFMGITAIINFGGGGSTQTVDINWQQGTQITLAMNAVNVIAEYNLQGGGAVLRVPTDLLLSAQVARGSIVGNQAAPQRTLPSFSVPSGIGGTSTFERIPNFAGRLYLTPVNTDFNTLMAASGSSFNILFMGADQPVAFSSALISTVRVDNYLTASGLSTGIPIPGRARYMALQNIDGTAPGAATCMWNFGINL